MSLFDRLNVIVRLESCFTPFMQVFISIALILGDGLYNFVRTLFFTGRSIYAALNKKNPVSCKLKLLLRN